jgi:hypothetical protein
MHRRALPVLLAVVVALLFAQGAEARVPQGFVGLGADDVFAGDQGYRTSNLNSMAGVGVQSIRQTFDWAQIERSPGSYNLTTYDDFVASCAAHGITVLPILFNTPLFYARKAVSRPVYPPKSNATFARFANVLVRRYGPSGSLWRERPSVPRRPISVWEFWNEPNLKLYWGNKPNAKQYVGLLAAGSGAVRKVDRGAEILTAGLPPSKLKGTVPLSRYIRQMYKARAKRYFADLAINSYARDQKALSRLLRSVRKIMNGRGARDRRAGIWVTEIGWGDRGPRHRFIVGSSGQAKRVSKSLDVIRKQRRRLRLRGFVYYAWRDAKPYPPIFRDLWGLHTGLLDLQGRPKPAFNAFKRAVGRLR